MTRHEERAEAVCLMFEYSYGGEPAEIMENARIYRGDIIQEFSEQLFLGSVEKLEETDTIIRESSENWRFERIARLPLAILRICIYEFLNLDIPVEIIVNEALELSREYGGEEYVSFINGVMANMIKKSGKE